MCVCVCIYIYNICILNKNIYILKNILSYYEYSFLCYIVGLCCFICSNLYPLIPNS